MHNPARCPFQGIWDQYWLIDTLRI